ncbi:hypothetical protein ARMGADRAFT_183903 [Armillaria gallica]|uniref:Uncharacterized protein n=1 Tax=Armillaria gallica TaxID=47427 RepID=A0A2H3DVH6_ARMGA|nr:hypothetical protein ARMGADRAFT_183903 [Armillaria gallica]
MEILGLVLLHVGQVETVSSSFFDKVGEKIDNHRLLRGGEEGKMTSATVWEAVSWFAKVACGGKNWSYIGMMPKAGQRKTPNEMHFKRLVMTQTCNR